MKASNFFSLTNDQWEDILKTSASYITPEHGKLFSDKKCNVMKFARWLGK
jgi:hypothetical protein